MLKDKFLKAKPPSIENVGRMNSTNYICYDMMLAHLGTCNSENDLINLINKKTIDEGKKYLKTSKKELLGSELLRRIYQLREPSAIVITGHLFIEVFLNKIIEIKFPYSYLILDNRGFTFNLKLEILKAKNYLDDWLYFDIKHLNSLRNKYAHSLLYDIADFDISQFLYFDLAYRAIHHESKRARHFLNTFLIKRVLIELLYRMTDKHKFLGEIKFNERK